MITQRQRKPEIYFHAGLPKAASTLLQRNIMPKFSGLQFVEKKDYKYHEKIVAESKSNKILFSKEFDWDLEDELKAFAGKFGRYKIIMVFRRQDSWIASRYRYHIRKNGNLSFDEFFNLERDKGFWKVDDLRFMDKIKLIEKYFPHDRPLVLFWEDLKNNPWGFIDKLAAYVGAEYDRKGIKLRLVKKAFKDKELILIRGFNRLFRYNPDRFKSKNMRNFNKNWRNTILYTLAGIGSLIPAKWILKEELVPKDKLKRIREYFESDWLECLDYAAEIDK